MDEAELVKKRLIELSERAYTGGVYEFTDFLGLMEQNILRSAARSEFPHVHYETFGGARGCERVMARFGDPEELGYTVDYPIAALAVRPRSEKYAEELTHRDYLGALMNLGIKRETLGDIPRAGLGAYIFVKEDLADFVCGSLTRVRHTDVTVSRAGSVPEEVLFRTEETIVKAESERLDGVIAKLYDLSREEAKNLFVRSLVFCDGASVASPSYLPKPGETVSVRGHGRFIYRGHISDTKKGKMNILVLRYV